MSDIFFIHIFGTIQVNKAELGKMTLVTTKSK